VGILETRLNRRIKLRFEDWRPGDQKIYISCIRKAQRELGWSPNIGVWKGVETLIDWGRSII
jgi:CDP-paratose 2-epimerase